MIVSYYLFVYTCAKNNNNKKQKKTKNKKKQKQKNNKKTKETIILTVNRQNKIYIIFISRIWKTYENRNSNFN